MATGTGLRARWWNATLLGVALGTAATAHAQRVDPEGGDTGAWQAPELADGSPSDGATTSREDDEGGDGARDGDQGESTSDHDHVVGRFGVGFFGVLEVTTGPVNTATGEIDTVPAPSLGVRHWLNERIGVEVAVGLGFSSANVGEDVDDPDASDSRNLGRDFGIVLHGGLPIALYHDRHYAFVVVPETNLGLGGGSADSTGGDDSFFGLLWDLGVRVGAELHFGFIGVPDLSLQASVGIRLRVSHGRETLCDADTECDTTSENRATNVGFGTTLEGDPWDIFTGAITAIYYF